MKSVRGELAQRPPRGGRARAKDHAPADADDRPVELDEPDQPDPPIDDEDRDPARKEGRSSADGPRSFLTEPPG